MSGRGRLPTRRDEVMAEWDALRSVVPFRIFPAMVGMTYVAWERMFQRARKAGDPRAVRVYEQRPLVPCGSESAYGRHLRRGETPCVECRAANAAATRVRKARRQARGAA